MDFFSDTVGAEDGNIALDHLSRRFDLIVSDSNMGAMDGLELLRRVRATPSTGKHSVHTRDREFDRARMARSDRARRHRVPRQAVHAQQFALRVSAEPRDLCVRRGRCPPSEGTIAEEAFSRLSRGTRGAKKATSPTSPSSRGTPFWFWLDACRGGFPCSSPASDSHDTAHASGCH